MICPVCSAKLPDGFRYCGMCGSILAGQDRPSKELCPSCGVTCDSRSLFCDRCGVPLKGGIGCPACGETNPPANAHCGACGTRLQKGGSVAPSGRMTRASLGASRGAAPGEEIRDEKKIVSVLFSDISGFTSMSETMDPEELKELMDHALSRLSEAIVSFGGHIDKYIGDAIMAIFGTPVAHEDDPERAVRSALAMQQVLGNYAAERKVNLRMRVGINTGPALLGAVGQKRADLTAMGDTVNLAQRMESNAPIGGVLITGNTARGLRGKFDLEELPPLKVKGKAEPVQAFVVKGERVGEPLPAAPLVGRERELALLDEAFAELLASGRPRLVTISGDAGLGKSRLAREWLSRAGASAETGSIVRPPSPRPCVARGSEGPTPEADAGEGTGLLAWKGQAVPFEAAPPFLPFAEMIRGWAGIREGDGPAIARKKVAAHLERLFGDEAESRADLLGYLLQAIPPGSPLLAEMESDPKGVRQRAIAIAIETVVRLSKERPLVLVFDDLQWARGPMLELVEKLAAWRGEARLLLLVLARPELFAETGFGKEIPGARLLLVEPLPPSDAIRLAGELLAGIEKVPDNFAELLAERSAGNPFYLEELVRVLADRKVFEEVDGRRTFHAGRFRPDEMPEGVSALLQARLDTLSDPTRDGLRKASVLGRTFWDRPLVQMTGGEVEPILEEATAAGLVRPKGASEFIGCREHEFPTTLLEEVAYKSLLKKERQEAHAVAGAWLEEAGRDRREEYLEAIANHWSEADQRAKAFPFLVDAAERARTLYLTDRALSLLDRALDIAGKGLAPGGAAERRKLLVRRGVVHRDAANYAKALEDLRLAESEAAAVHDGREGADISHEIAGVFFRWGNTESAIEEARRGLATARAVGNDSAAAGCLNILAHNHLEQGKGEEARREWEESRVIYGRLGDRRRELGILANLSKISILQGRGSESIEMARDVATAFSELGDRPNLAATRNFLGVIYCQTGDFSSALASFTEARAIFSAIGDRYGLELITNNLGRLEEQLGHLLESERFYEEAVRISIELGIEEGEAESLLGLGRIQLRRGRFDRADSAFLRAETIGRCHKKEAILSESAIGRAEVLLALARGNEAQIRLSEAAALAEKLGRSDLRAWARLVEGRIERTAGNSDRAVRILETALAEAKTAEEAFLEKQIDDELRLLGVLPEA